MPINVPDRLPAIQLLQEENIFIMNESRAEHQDIRPLKIIIVNLMPVKITTETDLIRLLSNTPLQLEVEFLRMKGHDYKNTPDVHMKAFYKTFDKLKSHNYDGMIITGAPVEMLPFEDVNYWKELTEIFDAAMAPGVRCWELDSDAEWTRTGDRDFHALLMRRAGDRTE